MALPTAEDIRERRPNATQSVSDERITELIDEIADVIERYRGYAQVPRTVTETVSPSRSMTSVCLSWSLVRSVTEVTVDGSPVQYTSVDRSAGIVYGAFPGHSEVIVSYEHGLESPEPIVGRLIAEYVASVLQSEASGTSRDIISQTFEGSVVRYSTPSWDDGRPTGFLEVDRLLNTMPDRRHLPVA